MNIMTFPWSRGADCRSFTAWLLNSIGPYVPTNPIRDSCSNLSLTRKSAHLVVGFAMIHGNQCDALHGGLWRYSSLLPGLPVGLPLSKESSGSSRWPYWSLALSDCTLSTVG